MVSHFESIYKNRHIVELADNKKVEFIGGELVTDDDGVAKSIRALKSFGVDIREVDGEIAQEKKRKYKVVSGAKGTDN